jgi:hypothetical protein
MFFKKEAEMQKMSIILIILMVFASGAFALEHEIDLSYAPEGNLVNIGSYKLIGLLGRENSLEFGYSLGPLPTEGYVFSLTIPKLSRVAYFFPGINLLLGGSNHRAKFDPGAVREAEEAVAKMYASRKGNSPQKMTFFPVVKVQRFSIKFIGKNPIRGEQAILADYQIWNRYLGGLIDEKRFLAGIITKDSPIFTGADFLGFFVSGAWTFTGLNDIGGGELKATLCLKDKKWSAQFMGMADIRLKKHLALSFGLNMRSLNGLFFDAEILGVDFIGLKFQKGNIKARAIFGADFYDMKDGEPEKVRPHIGINFRFNPDLR